MLEGQMKALASLAKREQPCEIEIKNANGEKQKVLVNIKVNAFKFGVNKGAFMMGAYPLTGSSVGGVSSPI